MSIDKTAAYLLDEIEHHGFKKARRLLNVQYVEYGPALIRFRFGGKLYDLAIKETKPKK